MPLVCRRLPMQELPHIHVEMLGEIIFLFQYSLAADGRWP
jgi:hypothetical protein